MGVVLWSGQGWGIPRVWSVGVWVGLGWGPEGGWFSGGDGEGYGRWSGGILYVCRGVSPLDR